ncbi:MAG: hypothetical protein RDU76_08200 [Candidatus Edwardsbacteria bacterium]|nr:hypothetical protein [Candidatus Edwardsbacteria bacterium]
MKINIFCLLFIISQIVYGQTKVIELKPIIGETPDFSIKAQREFAIKDSLIRKLEETREYEKLTKKEKEILGKYEAFDSIWDILGNGCSWYCGGGPYKIISSSFHKPEHDIFYDGTNAHDFSYKTSWVEGKPGYGIGEYLEYSFKNDSPRLTNIIIFNGIIKSHQTWKYNTRVKLLEVFVNGSLYAILHLQDTRAAQKFKLPEPLGRRKDGQDLVMKFVIKDIYKGEKYDDTAITELYFDGIDVH